MTTAWRYDAKCWGKAEEWDISTLGRFDREAKARALCAGCEVLIDCAKNVYEHPETVGVIAAGMVIGGDSLTPNDVRQRLADLLDVEFVPARRAVKSHGGAR